MDTKTSLLCLLIVAFLGAACSGTGPALAGGQAAEAPVNAPVKDPRAACPVTTAPKAPFVPPDPWPAAPPGEAEFWYGTPGLWTALPESGDWPQLAYGEKFWWWSEEFDVREDATPDLTVTARRLDGDSPGFQVGEATNGYHPSFNWAMLIGVEALDPGCWTFKAEYKGHELELVVWVPAG